VTPVALMKFAAFMAPVNAFCVAMLVR